MSATLGNLAKAFRDPERFGEADAGFERALNAGEEIQWEGHPAVAPILAAYADTYSVLAKIYTDLRNVEAAQSFVANNKPESQQDGAPSYPLPKTGSVEAGVYQLDRAPGTAPPIPHPPRPAESGFQTRTASSRPSPGALNSIYL